MASPILTVTLVDQNSFPFLGSVVTCNSQSTVIALACPPEIAEENAGICPFNPTITYGPSTYDLSVSNNQFDEGPTAVSCIAIANTPKYCTTSQRQSTFGAETYSEVVVPSVDLTSVPVTLTAGVEKLCPGISGLSYVSTTAAASTQASMTTGSTPASGVTSTMPSATSGKNSGSRNAIHGSVTGLMLYLLPMTWMFVQLVAL